MCYQIDYSSYFCIDGIIPGIQVNMPFQSKTQMRLCYSRSRKDWDCDEFLKATESVCALPERKGSRTSRKRKSKKSLRREVSRWRTGPRGGRYRTIREYDDKKLICETKVYKKIK